MFKVLILLISSLSAFGQVGFGSFSIIPTLSGSLTNGGSLPQPCLTTNTVILHSDTAVFNTNNILATNGELVSYWINMPLSNKCDALSVTNTAIVDCSNSYVTNTGPTFLTNGPNGQPYLSFIRTSSDALLSKPAWCLTGGLISNTATFYYAFRPYAGDFGADPSGISGTYFLDLGGQIHFCILPSGQLDVFVPHGSPTTDYVLGTATQFLTNWYLLSVSISSNSITIRTNGTTIFNNSNVNAHGNMYFGAIGGGNNQGSLQHLAHVDIAAVEIYPSYDAGTVTITNREQALRTKYNLW